MKRKKRNDGTVIVNLAKYTKGFSGVLIANFLYDKRKPGKSQETDKVKDEALR